MRRNHFVSLVCSEEEFRMIEAVAVGMHRSRSDALRLLARQAAEAMGVAAPTPSPTNVVVQVASPASETSAA